MDDDFSIEVFAPQGHEVLRPHLALCPFSVTIGWSEAAKTEVLVQDRVSHTTGFSFELRKGSFYGYWAHGPARDIEGIAAMLRAAELSHRIERIQHELDGDDEFMSYLSETGEKPERWHFFRH